MTKRTFRVSAKRREEIMHQQPERAIMRLMDRVHGFFTTRLPPRSRRHSKLSSVPNTFKTGES
jgi:hypothetical protein